MRITAIIFSIFLFILMALLTALCYTDVNDAKFLFVGTSADYLVNLTTVNPTWPTLFLLGIGGLLIYYFKKPTKIKLAFLLPVFLLWVISGRSVATYLYTDGIIVTGWFYISTNSFTLCPTQNDCEDIAYKTKIEKLPFYAVTFKNSNIDKTVFVGPFAWSSTIKTLADDHITEAK